MVWFYLLSLIFNPLRTVSFQSHYGLILSRHPASPPLWQLRQLSIPLWSDFIRVRSAGGWLIREGCTFNPTMVWFYQVPFSHFTPSRTHFQSHYGLILSTSVSLYGIFVKNLSIPLWSDFIVAAEYLRCVPRCFQSHYGLILSSSNFFSAVFRSSAFNPTMVWFYQRNSVWRDKSDYWLSIPLWSDFIE